MKQKPPMKLEKTNHLNVNNVHNAIFIQTLQRQGRNTNEQTNDLISVTQRVP